MSDYNKLRSKLFAKVNGWLEQSSNVSNVERGVEEQNMSSSKGSVVINQRKNLGLSEISIKIKKPPIRAHKILGLAKKINKIPKVADIITAFNSTVPDVINVPDRTTEDVPTNNIIVADTTAK